MAEKQIDIRNLKVPSEENLRRIISVIKGLSAQTSSLEEQCIKEFSEDEIYTKGRACFKDGNLYLAITTHQGIWTDNHFNLVDGTEVSYLSRLDIEDLFANTSSELWDYLGGIISDEISTKKTWSSSKIYEELMDLYARCIEYCVKQIAKSNTASYKVISSESQVTEGKYIYLIKDGDGYQMWILTDDGALNIGSTNIDMSEYYTKEETDETFLTQNDATVTYATIEQVEEIIDDTVENSETSTFSAKKISQNYMGKYLGENGEQTFDGDLNNLTDIGVYSIASKINTPITTATCYGTLVVTKGSYNGFISQTFVMTNGNTHIRQYVEGSWKPWTQVASLNDSIDSIDSTWSSKKIGEVNGAIWKGVTDRANTVESVFDFIKENFEPSRIIAFRVDVPEGLSSPSVFGNASITCYAALSSFNYGWIFAMSDSTTCPVAFAQLRSGKWTDWLSLTIANSIDGCVMLYQNLQGEYLRNPRSFTATRSGLCECVFYKEMAGYTVTIAVNGIRKNLFANYWGTNVYVTLDVPVNKGDVITISHDAPSDVDSSRLYNLVQVTII